MTSNHTQHKNSRTISIACGVALIVVPTTLKVVYDYLFSTPKSKTDDFTIKVEITRNGITSYQLFNRREFANYFEICMGNDSCRSWTESLLMSLIESNWTLYQKLPEKIRKSIGMAKHAIYVSNGKALEMVLNFCDQSTHDELMSYAVKKYDSKTNNFKISINVTHCGITSVQHFDRRTFINYFEICMSNNGCVSWTDALLMSLIECDWTLYEKLPKKLRESIGMAKHAISVSNGEALEMVKKFCDQSTHDELQNYVKTV